MTSAGIDEPIRSTASPAFPDAVSLRSPLAARAAIDACDALARAGRLPGFRRTSPTSCTARIFGQPFDRDLVVEATDAPHGSVVRLSTRLRRRAPIIFTVVSILTVWPGVWLTDSLIQTYFTGASQWVVKTWMWYLPLAILPLPFAARSMWRKSVHASAEHFAEVAQRVARAVGASSDAWTSSAGELDQPAPEGEPISASA